MKTRYLLAIACAALVALPARAALPVRAMYADAMAREDAVRAALAAPSASESVLKAVRDAVGSYESVVRHYPTSGYSDNALWQAGRLSLDAFERFGQPRDKDAGIRLLRLLATEYPTSKLARQVAAQLSVVPDSAASVPPSNPKNARGHHPSARVYARARGEGPPRASQKVATITNIRRAVLLDTVRVTIEIDAEVPSFHEERIADPRGSSSTFLRRARPPRWWSRRSDSRATPTSFVRCASGGIPTTRRASCSTRPVCRVTASTRSTTHTAS